MKNLVFKKRPVKNLIELYVGSYMVEKMVSKKCSEVKAAGLYEDLLSGKS